MHGIQEHAGAQREPHVELSKCPKLYITYVTYCTQDGPYVCVCAEREREEILHYIAPAGQEERGLNTCS